MTTLARSTDSAPATLDELSVELDSLLDAYLARYEQWLSLATAQREGIRRADGAEVERTANAQAIVMQAVSMLEQRRGALVNTAAVMVPAVARDRSRPVTLHDVATHLPGAGRAGLLGKAERLRELVRTVHSQTQSIAGATRALLNHFEGLMRHVARSLSHAGTYSRNGVVEAGGAVVSALDLRS